MDQSPIDIAALRKRLNLSQEDLATEIGVDRSNVSRWEKGITRPRGSAQKLLEAVAKRPSPKAEGAVV